MNQRLLNHGNPSLLAFTSASQQKTIYSTKEDAFALAPTPDYIIRSGADRNANNANLLTKEHAKAYDGGN